MQPLTPNPSPARGEGSSALWLARMLTAFLMAAALVLVCRRLAGALNTPPPSAALALTLFVLLSAAATAHWLLGRSGRRNVGASLLISASVVMLAAALSFLSSKPALAALWTPLLAGEGWAWWKRVGRRVGHRRLRPSPLEMPTDKLVLASIAAVPADGGAVPGEEVCQQLTLNRAPDGSLLLTGWLRAAFAPGQRTEHIHVAFCPPFPHSPRLQVQQRGGPAARVKTAQLLPCGARLDLKLAAAASVPQSVLLSFSAAGDASDTSTSAQPGPMLS